LLSDKAKGRNSCYTSYPLCTPFSPEAFVFSSAV
jgi:hypothetical protein